MLNVFSPISRGPGRTVMVKVTILPAQLSEVAFTKTVMLAVIGLVVVFFGINGRIFPLPLSGKPIAVLLFVQLKDAPAVLLVKGIPPLTRVPLQYDLLDTTSITGVGFTVTFTESVVTHPVFVDGDNLKVYF